MHINDEHMYQGAALTQIAKRGEFKAINSFPGFTGGAYRINADIGIYIKYANSPTETTHKEYLFGFTANNRAEIEKIKEQCKKVFIVLVCIEAAQICALTSAQFDKLIKSRSDAYHAAYGKDEAQPNILVTAQPNKQFQVYVNQAKKKGGLIGKIFVSRNAFPGLLFSN